MVLRPVTSRKRNGMLVWVYLLRTRMKIISIHQYIIYIWMVSVTVSEFLGNNDSDGKPEVRTSGKNCQPSRPLLSYLDL